MPIVSWRAVATAILTLVPTPSVAATRIGSAEAGRFEIEEAAEAADLGVRAGARGPAQQRLDQLDHAVAGIDVDAGGRVACRRPRVHQLGGDPVPVGAMRGASYVGIAGCASARPPLYGTK